MTPKEIFCHYLEETVNELRTHPETNVYIYEVCKNLIEYTEEFCEESIKKNKVRIIR
jgi:hypothetical protein